MLRENIYNLPNGEKIFIFLMYKEPLKAQEKANKLTKINRTSHGQGRVTDI